MNLESFVESNMWPHPLPAMAPGMSWTHSLGVAIKHSMGICECGTWI